MRSWSIPIGRFFGADFRLHFTFVILLIYVVVSESSPNTAAIPRASALAALIVLAVLVLARDMPALDATRRAVAIGQGFSMMFLIAGLLSNPWLLWLGAFLFVGGQLEERNVVFQSVLENVRMEDVMLTDFSTLSPADTL